MLHQAPRPAEVVSPVEVLPYEVDVVVIGGGIIGACTAYQLASAGSRVLVCEKGMVGAEQSSRNWGWVRKLRRDVREIPLAMESMRMWDGLDAELGAPIGFRRTGIVYGARKQAEIEAQDAWLRAVAEFNLDVKRLSRSELNALLPGAGGHWKMALHCPSDGRAEPHLVAPAFANAAIRKGAQVAIGCAVRGVETTNGRVSAIVTERGRVRCSAVVVAGGVWSQRILRELDIRLPQLGVSNTVMRLGPVENGPVPCFWAGDAAWGRRPDGGYLISDGGGHIADITPDSFRYLREFLPSLVAQWGKTKLRFGASFFHGLKDNRRRPFDQPSPYERTRILNPKPDLKSAIQSLDRLVARFTQFGSAHPPKSGPG